MGTNYYLEKTNDKCPTCGHNPSKPLHIGKSSFGWVFALHVETDDPSFPSDLNDWIKLFNSEGSQIKDEYGTEILPEMMINIITKKEGSKRSEPFCGNCVGNGDGPWDLHVGEFY